ncbi:MAG: CpaF family protein [Candidatus Diapherotrites archaeon]
MENYMSDLFAKVKGKPVQKDEKKVEESLVKEDVKVKESLSAKQSESFDVPFVKPKSVVDSVLSSDSSVEVDEQDSEYLKKLADSEKELIEVTPHGKIYRVSGKSLLYYWAPVSRPIGAERAIINTIKEAATRIITISPYKIRDPEERRNVYFQKILEIIRESPELRIPANKQEFYAEVVVREMVGYGLIDTLIKDELLEEIMVIGPHVPVYVFHRKYGMMITNIEFYGDNEIQDLINRMARTVGRRVDLAMPLLDARLPDGSRVNATIPPASVDGSTLTIRKFRKDPYSIVDLINFGTLSTEVAAFLWLCVEGLKAKPANLLISGGTGSGKTTLLNVLASFIPETERVVSIEDTAELKLPLEHWVRLEARPPGLEGTGEITLDILTKNSLRMRPDRILVGEIRHAEAFALFTAMNTGHEGCMGTVHANSPQETLIRVMSPPMNVPEVMLAGLNFVVIEHRLHDKKVGAIRRITEIAEVYGALEGKPTTETIYKRDASSDTLIRTKSHIQYLKVLEERTGLSQDQIAKELKRREVFLRELVAKKESNMDEVSRQMKEFLMRSEHG